MGLTHKSFNGRTKTLTDKVSYRGGIPPKNQSSGNELNISNKKTETEMRFGNESTEKEISANLADNEDEKPYKDKKKKKSNCCDCWIVYL